MGREEAQAATAPVENLPFPRLRVLPPRRSVPGKEVQARRGRPRARRCQSPPGLAPVPRRVAQAGSHGLGARTQRGGSNCLRGPAVRVVARALCAPAPARLPALLPLFPPHPRPAPRLASASAHSAPGSATARGARPGRRGEYAALGLQARAGTQAGPQEVALTTTPVSLFGFPRRPGEWGGGGVGEGSWRLPGWMRGPRMGVGKLGIPWPRPLPPSHCEFGYFNLAARQGWGRREMSPSERV